MARGLPNPRPVGGARTVGPVTRLGLRNQQPQHPAGVVDVPIAVKTPAGKQFFLYAASHSMGFHVFGRRRCGRGAGDQEGHRSQCDSGLTVGPAGCQSDR